jgi:hypothetical protein
MTQPKSVRGLPKPHKAGIQSWPLAKVYQTLKEGRSVILVFGDGTLRRKYVMRIIREAVAFVGEPTTAIPPGDLEPRSVYWPNKAGLGLALKSPDELEMGSPPETDIVRPIFPPDWR